jgi:hypothetical protein
VSVTYPDDPPECARCGQEYLLEGEDEVDESELCHACAYARIGELEKERDQLQRDLDHLRKLHSTLPYGESRPWSCTCGGECKGAAGLAPGWQCRKEAGR